MLQGKNFCKTIISQIVQLYDLSKLFEAIIVL